MCFMGGYLYIVESFFFFFFTKSPVSAYFPGVKFPGEFKMTTVVRKLANLAKNVLHWASLKNDFNDLQIILKISFDF